MTQPLPSLTEARLLLGDEAVAFGALDAGISAAYAYPGTPSTEIFETLVAQGPEGVSAHWCANEKTAFEQALGASMAGSRVLVTMKHVGLNVAMDPFVNSGLVGIRGGLVLAVADDPGMHSSQNEQDSRVLADFARVPCLEPADPQEAYDLVREAFSVSERFRTPVVLRLVTRLCHGRAVVTPRVAEAGRVASKPDSPRDWILLPANARRLWRDALHRYHALREWSEAAVGEVRFLPRADQTSDAPVGGDRPLGVITTGIARSYLREAVRDADRSVSHLHLDRYPFPEAVLRGFAHDHDELLVVEEGSDFLERHLKGILPPETSILGRGSDHLPADGELTPDRVRHALGLPARTGPAPALDLPVRPPQLCPGCPHRDAFDALRAALADVPEYTVTGDIGCYTLGALPPFQALESCVCMGASIGMAKGMADAGLRPAVAVIGDSTFLHSGVTPLMDAVAHDTPMTVLILDNSTVGMTGQQPTVLPDSRLEPIVLGVGVDPDHCHVVETHPKHLDTLTAILRAEIQHPGVSVVIGVRECIVAARKRKAYERRLESVKPKASAAESERVGVGAGVETGS